MKGARVSGLLAASLASYCAALEAFPGAEGFGAQATGGRGGSVYVVTNLNDTGDGSFRDAVSESHRIVVFAVGGIINIDSRIVVKNDITIAGQTAPGDGITIYGNGLSYSNADNTITRYIRYRMGRGGDSGKDGITIADGANMIFDHVSVSWGRDETFSINGDVSNVTIQDSIIAQGLQTHSCGGLMQTTGGLSIFRTLYADNKTRNPKVKGVNDFTNNVVYNWGGGGGYIEGDSSAVSEVNIVGNAFISGPSTSVSPFTRGNKNFNAYVADNYYDPDQDGTLNGHVLSVDMNSYTDITFKDARFAYPAPATLMNSTEALAYVMEHAGASLVRDSVDKYILDEVASYGTKGALISDEDEVGGPGSLAGGEAPTDTDGDGIPDEYETANGLDPQVDDAMDIADNGYANIENYINSLV
ncbi:polysaccharide lyase family 1 protein [Schizophyllum commune Tattone D]|nr:polysaccharide lyase family 1 protein [Schizophyllum commune Loenen D]KAI5825464.1 polysaccharide lyase family 1 protein [Schizophyllum commune Tattone D]